MSTVLWANVLQNGKVESDESDKYALYEFTEQLDELTKELEVTSFQNVLDHTDCEFNFSEEDLPEGMDSTNEIMAQNGVWIAGDEAVIMLEALINHISNEEVIFDDKSGVDEVLEELRESLVFANKAKQLNAQFNFSVVM